MFLTTDHAEHAAKKHKEKFFNIDYLISGLKKE